VPHSSSSHSCSDFMFDDCGRAPIGVAQGLGHDYPLVDPSDDIRYLLADAYLSYDDPVDYDLTVVPGCGTPTPGWQPAFSIKWLFGAGCAYSHKPAWAPTPTHDVDILVVDANDNTVFDSTTATFKTKEWSDRLMIYEWTGSDAVMRIVVHTKWQDDTVTPQDYDEHIMPADGRLDVRTVTRMPKRVKSITVGLTTMTGEIELESGFNIKTIETGDIQDGDDVLATQLRGRPGQPVGGGRAGKRFSINAIPGAGLGRWPGCDDEVLTINRINSTAPGDRGDFLFSTERSKPPCYWFERPSTLISAWPRVTDVTPATLQLHNNCVPCCSCDDFVEVKKGIDSVYGRWLTLGRSAERIRNTYAVNRTRWLAQKDCRESQPQRLTLVTACEGLVGIGYSFCHMARECEGPLEVTFTFETFTGSSESIIPATYDFSLVGARTRKNEITGGMKPYEMGGTMPTVTAYWDLLNAYSAAKLTMVARGCDTSGDAIMAITANATLNGVPYPTLEVFTSIEPPCEEGKGWGDPC
jgi:hypothetical protein